MGDLSATFAQAEPPSSDGSRPLISFIIPTLNEAKIIVSTLRTLASTLTLPHEIIVSDGGSNDDTVELVRPYATATVTHTADRRQTISQGRNAGAAVARGEFLVFLDADCVIPDPDRFFARAFAHFTKDPRLVALTAYLWVFPEDATMADRLVFGAANLGLTVSNNIFRSGHSFGEFQMMRREAFDRVGGFREDLVTIEDADMFRRLSRIGRTRIDPGLTVLHTGRRGHQVGWVPLITMWMVNSVFVLLFDRPVTKEWKPIR